MVKIQTGTNRLTFENEVRAREFCIVANSGLSSPCIDPSEADNKVVYLPYFMRHWQDEIFGAPWSAIRNFLMNEGIQREY